MKKDIKKGFTLVELLVVIAILAILATVSIVGYTSFIKKASYSNDETLVTQWNKLLDGNSILASSNNNDKLNNIVQIKNFLKENGTNDDDFIPQSDGYHFYWYEEDNNIYLVEDKAEDQFNIAYPEINTEANKDSSYRLDLEYNLITGFDPQYKYEINQLAKYMNMDGDDLEDLLLAWTNNASNRNKSYIEILNDINTKNDALCIAAVYILGTEHILVSDTIVSITASRDVAKGILNSDVIFKNINRIFIMANNNEIPDGDFIAYLSNNILKIWNEEILKVLGLDGIGKVPVKDIYDAFKYSIDHANELPSIGNTYTLTANAINKIMNILNPDASISLNDIKASMDRMISKSNNGTVLSTVISEFNNANEDGQKQIAYDYATYCYMCMFGLLSGDFAYDALSKHFTEKDFTSLDAIGYVLNDDYIFKSIAKVIESMESNVSTTIFSAAYDNLIVRPMLSDIYGNYTDDFNDMYKAIGEIFNGKLQKLCESSYKKSN